MRKRDIIKYKKQSLAKWQKIVRELELVAELDKLADEPVADILSLCVYQPELTHSACGYCSVYFMYDPYDSNRECENCPLDKCHLCYGGSGDSFTAVDGFFINGSNDLKAALKGARTILRAIERDLS